MQLRGRVIVVRVQYEDVRSHVAEITSHAHVRQLQRLKLAKANLRDDPTVFTGDGTVLTHRFMRGSSSSIDIRGQRRPLRRR